jgi:sugar transferase (PEP-CTERM/EpsH1 system associated)
VRVLFLATRFPYPPRRGDQVRAFHHLRHLAPHHDLTLCVVGAPPDPTARGVVESMGIRVRSIGNPVPFRAARLVRAAWDRRPFQVLPVVASRLRGEVARLAADHDVVHAQLVRTGPLVEDLAVPVVIDLVDALSMNLERRSAHDRGPGRWAAAWEARRLPSYERRLAAHAAAAVVSTADDAAAIGDPSIHVVPNGVDTTAFAYDPTPRADQVLVFAGNLGYFPNVDAAVTLAAEVLPAVRRTVPGARVVLAGARPTRTVRHLASPVVSVVADPDDLAPVVAAAAVAVVPMRAGTGIQNKVLEAMSVGTPVVTTARVASAVGGRHEEHLLVAEGTDGFAAAVARVLADPSLAASLATRGRALVEERYRWEASAAAIGALWESAGSA